MSERGGGNGMFPIGMRVRRGERRGRRGFTLVESAVVLGVIAVLVALSLVAVGGMRRTTSFSSTTNDLLARMRWLRSEAFAHGADTVLVVQRSTGRYWAILDPAGDFDLALFQPTAPTDDDDRLLGAFELAAPAQFGPDDGHGGPLPRPFAWVPASTPCTPCVDDLAAVVFRGDGTAALSGPHRDGGSFSLVQPGSAPRTFAIVGHTGAIEAFERR